MARPASMKFPPSAAAVPLDSPWWTKAQSLVNVQATSCNYDTGYVGSREISDVAARGRHAARPPCLRSGTALALGASRAMKAGRALRNGQSRLAQPGPDPRGNHVRGREILVIAGARARAERGVERVAAAWVRASAAAWRQPCPEPLTGEGAPSGAKGRPTGAAAGARADWGGAGPGVVLMEQGATMAPRHRSLAGPR